MKPESIDEAVQAIEGALLSDATISPGGYNWCFKISQSHREHRDWLQYLGACFGELGIGSSIRTYANNQCRDGCFHVLRSGSHQWLTEQRQRWYPGGKKIVPEDLKVTAALLANLIMGDGSGDRSWGIGRPVIILCTMGFDDLSLCRLKAKLGAVGLPDVRLTKRNMLYIGTEGTSKVIAACSDFILPSFKYKLKVGKL